MDTLQSDSLAKLYVSGWTPEKTNQSSDWQRKDDRDTASPFELCWNPEGNILPAGISQMSDDEIEVCHEYIYGHMSFALS